MYMRPDKQCVTMRFRARACVVSLICLFSLHLVTLEGFYSWNTALSKDYRHEPPSAEWFKFKQAMASAVSPALQDLIAMLDSLSVADRIYAAIRIRALGTPAQAAIPKLIEKLSDGSMLFGEERGLRDREYYTVKDESLNAIRSFGALAVPELISFIYSDQKDFGVPLLLRPHGTEFDSARFSAFDLLMTINDSRAMEFLVSYLENPPETIMVNNVLSRLNADIFMRLTPLQQETILHSLMRYLHEEGDVNRRLSAVDALGNINDRRAIEPLKSALGDIKEVRFRAAFQLANFYAAPEAIGPLKETLLGSAHQGDRIWAARMLSKFCSKLELAAALKQAMKDSDPYVRSEAKEVLESCR